MMNLSDKLPHYHDAALPKHPRFGGQVPPAIVAAVRVFVSFMLFLKSFYAVFVLKRMICKDPACPYSIAPPAYQSRWKPLRFLLLQPKAAADSTTDPTYRRLMTEKSSYVYAKTLEHWGPGWPEYLPWRTLVHSLDP